MLSRINLLRRRRGIGDITISTHYNRVITDGGVIESNQKMLDIAKDIYNSKDLWSNLTHVVSEYLGYKLGTTDANGYPHIAKLYNLTGLGDFIQNTASLQPLLCKWDNYNHLECLPYQRVYNLFQTSGVVDIRVCMWPNYTGTGDRVIASHHGTTKITHSLKLWTDGTTKTLRYIYTLDGSTQLNKTSSAFTPPANAPYWVRCKRNPTTGLIEFWWAENTFASGKPEPLTWTAIGSSTGTTGTLYQQPTVNMEFGSARGGQNNLLGRIYRGQIWEDDVLRVDFDPGRYNPNVSVSSLTDTLGNTFSLSNSSSYTYVCGYGICYRTMIITDGVDDFMEATVNTVRPSVVINSGESTNNIFINGVAKFTETSQKIGYNGTTYGRSKGVLLIAHKDIAKQYARTDLLEVWLNYNHRYYAPAYNSSSKTRYGYIKTQYNISTGLGYNSSHLSTFLTKYNNGDNIKTLAITDSLGGVATLGVRKLNYLKNGFAGLGYFNATPNNYQNDIISVTTSGTWTDKVYPITGNMTGLEEDWGLSGFYTTPAAGATMTITPSSFLRFSKLKVHYAKNSGLGSFDVVMNSVTTSVNCNGTAGLGTTEIDITEGNYPFVINNTSGTLKIYGFELVNANSPMHYGLNRGASDTGHWSNFTVIKRSLDYIAAVNPDLIIISIGFNDLNEPSVVLPNMALLIDKLHEISGAEILLTTSGNRCLSTTDFSPNPTILNNSNLLWPEYKKMSDNDNKLAVFHLNPTETDTAKLVDYWFFVSDYVHKSSKGFLQQADCMINGIFGI